MGLPLGLHGVSGARAIACVRSGTAPRKILRAKGLCPQHNDLHDRHGFPPVDIQPPLRVSALPYPTHGRWAACAGRSPDSRLWRSLQPSRRSQQRGLQWHLWSELAAYSCGGSLGLGACRAAPCSRFHRPRYLHERNRHAANRRNLRCAVNGLFARHFIAAPAARAARLRKSARIQTPSDHSFGRATRCELRELSLLTHNLAARRT